LAEPFEEAKQVGSSTMPHKRNPELSERICGLAKIMRSLVQPALENVPTWHERDLTQSSAERFIIPEAFIILDYMTVNMTQIIQNVYVNKRKMMRNLNLTQGRAMSESVMLALARKGLGRQEGHELIRKLSIKSESEHSPFREVLVKDPIVTKYLKPSEIYAALEPESYLGTAIKQIEFAIRRTQMERSARKISD
ncbi:MAG TPA: adenylosuccinate lyase, partial [archaeon]|nr:adenylosuccinate lyase [archaeon]